MAAVAWRLWLGGHDVQFPLALDVCTLPAMMRVHVFTRVCTHMHTARETFHGHVRHSTDLSKFYIEPDPINEFLAKYNITLELIMPSRSASTMTGERRPYWVSAALADIPGLTEVPAEGAKVRFEVDEDNATVAKAVHLVAPPPEDATPPLTCCICYCEFDRTAGIECESDEKHFVCDDCFGSHVTAESMKEVDLLHKCGGEVFCPACPFGDSGLRGTPYPPGAIARHVSDEVFRAYLKGKEKLIEQIVEQAAIAAERERAEAEYCS